MYFWISLNIHFPLVLFSFAARSICCGSYRLGEDATVDRARFVLKAASF